MSIEWLPSEMCHFPEENCSCTVLFLSCLLPFWCDVLVSIHIFRRQYYALEDLQVVKDTRMKDPSKASRQFWFCFDLYTLFHFIGLNHMVSSSWHYIHCLQYSKVMQGFRDFLGNYLLIPSFQILESLHWLWRPGGKYYFLKVFWFSRNYIHFCTCLNSCLKCGD